MTKEKIAILTDTCCDVPKTYIERYHMYVLPLKIIYHDREYIDGVNITPREIYDHLDQEIPKTSLPDGETIVRLFDQIKQDGYDKVIAVTLSSGLSGTHNMVSLMARDYEGLNIFVLDTKNIAIGAGFHAIQAGRYIEQGLDFETISEKLALEIKRSKVFFVVKTLEYLQKGGRIGLVASLFGNALNLKPIISCNDEGIYYTVAKVRGRSQSIHKTMDLALKFAEGHKRYDVAVVHGDGLEDAERIKEILLPKLPGKEVLIEGQISPALGVHTGPGSLAIGIHFIEE